jgi:polysaccharide deacetylase family protein (PEP-CTERM system associated)
MDKEQYILLTIDVEDWFQVENFKPWIPFSTWDQRELRVERNVHRLLDLFDSVNSAGKLEARGQKANRIESYEARMPGGSENSEPSSLLSSKHQASSVRPSSLQASRPQASSNKPSSFPASQPLAEGKPKATFFVLGWIAEKLPHLVREIHARGHEVASHGYHHDLPDKLSSRDLKRDLTDSKKHLEDIIGAEVHGYRAPNFAVNDDVLKTVEDCGYLYDSSYNSFGMHGRYGKISLNGSSKKGIAHKIADNFFELPISNLEFNYPISSACLVKFFEKDSEANLTGEPSAMTSGQNDKKRFVLPWGGGGYFRIIPLSIFKFGVKSILERENAYLLYLHPWEIDKDQPRVDEASLNFKFRHYRNLGDTYSKLASLISSFNFCNFATCQQFLLEAI